MILALLFSISTAHAQFGDILGGFFNGGGNQNTGIFQAPRDQRSLFNTTRWANANPEEYGACKAQYDNWLSDGVMDISLVIGYHDFPSQGSTLDRQSFSEIRAILKRDCTQTASKVCGFKWVANELPNNLTVLEKTFTSYDGKPVKIRFTLGYTSASNNDRANTGGNGVIAPQQEPLSIDSETQYFGSIANATCEVCGYLGHARNGGGPDFRPVPYAWRDNEGEPVYARYLENRTAYRRLLESLMSGAQRARQLIVIMGCSSKSHFMDNKICPVEQPGCQPLSLSDFSRTTGFMVSGLLSWSQNRDQYLGALLDTLTGLKCRSAIDQNLGGMGRFPKPEAYQILGSFLN